MSVKIVQGEDKTITVTLKDGNGDAYDLTAATEITAEILKSDDTCVSVTLTGGKITKVGS